MAEKEILILRGVTVAQSLGFCREVMRRMRQLGWRSVAVSSPGPELDSLSRDEGFECFALPMERHISPWRDLCSLVKMVRLMRRLRPQIVHSMTPKAGLICMAAAWLTGVPVRIHTFTGLIWPTATGFKRRLLMFTDRLTCAFASHIIPEGEGVKADLIAGHITRKPLKVLGFGNVRGVDLQVFDPERLSVEKDPATFTFLFVGRIVGDKGINELVTAFTAIHSLHPNARLRLVGKLESDLDPLAPDTLSAIQSNPAIEAVGPMYSDDLIKQYAQADCFVMPSYREGFPNTVLEAGAMGLPSIVTDINGSREIITNGHNGLIVPPRNATALQSAMLQLLTDADARHHMASNARPLIQQRFEKNFVQSCLIKFYQEIINQTGPTASPDPS